MTIKLYDKQADSETWNRFVDSGKNSTFLFHRNFMDYHADRFTDHSLMAYDGTGRLTAVLPANLSNGGLIHSHQGLTYGGWIFDPQLKLTAILSIFYHALHFLNKSGIQEMNYKSFPAFYSNSPTDEVEYALFLLDAELYRRDTALVIDNYLRIPYSGNIRREANKGRKMGAAVREDTSMEEFWKQILEPNLVQRYGVKPVHNLEEISLLKRYFPQNIRQFNIYFDGKIMAGTTLFVTPSVVHCQYISASEEGRKTGCLNYLFCHLIDEVFSDYHYFDFGIVNQNGGRSLNKGMLFWKESFGGRVHKHDFYRIRTDRYCRLATFMN